jgi:Putative beta-barrel porin-2, OmpL-like. bbp2
VVSELYAMKPLCIFILLQFVVCFTKAQDSLAGKKWQLSGFIDLYYQYDFNEPLSNERPPFVYNHKKHNRPSVNLSMLKLAYNKNKWKGNLALMAGDYARNNLAAEPRWLQYVYEANVGYRFTDKFSAEAGILPSHLGIESAISKDCWNLSRSLLAENSPYFETGMKLNYTFNSRWSASVLLLNGWQHIKENNKSKAIGTQLVFKPHDKWLLNSSSFIGNEQPDSVAAHVRVFHNLYITYELTRKMNIAFLFDAGTEERQTWWGTAALFQYKINKKLNAAARAEYYNDPHAIIITAFPATGLKVSGYSFNVDFIPASWLTLRTEVKYMNSAADVFDRNGQGVNKNLSLLLSLAAEF